MLDRVHILQMSCLKKSNIDNGTRVDLGEGWVVEGHRAKKQQQQNNNNKTNKQTNKQNTKTSNISNTQMCEWSRFVLAWKSGLCIQVKNFVTKSYISPVRYKRTTSNKGKLVLSRPYVDAFGAGIVITMAKTLVEGRCVHLHTLQIELCILNLCILMSNINTVTNK